MVTSDLGRVTTACSSGISLTICIVVTSDLGRVTTSSYNYSPARQYCGDVRSRTSYNFTILNFVLSHKIVVTSDLGRVTTVHQAYP